MENNFGEQKRKSANMTVVFAEGAIVNTAERKSARQEANNTEIATKRDILLLFAVQRIPLKLEKILKIRAEMKHFSSERFHPVENTRSHGESN